MLRNWWLKFNPSKLKATDTGSKWIIHLIAAVRRLLWMAIFLVSGPRLHDTNTLKPNALRPIYSLRYQRLGAFAGRDEELCQVFKAGDFFYAQTT